MATNTTISVTIVVTGKTRAFDLRMKGTNVSIPVDEQLFAHYVNQFPRNTQLQKNRFTTLFSLMEAAYRAGLADGKKQK